MFRGLGSMRWEFGEMGIQGKICDKRTKINVTIFSEKTRSREKNWFSLFSGYWFAAVSDAEKVLSDS